jgi:hypothetical protein
VQAYKRAVPSQLKRIATDIYLNYITAGAENQVNFSASHRETLSRRISEPRPAADCFKDVEREAVRLLLQVSLSNSLQIHPCFILMCNLVMTNTQNGWPSFRDSVQFRLCSMIIRGLIPPPARARGGPSVGWQAVGTPLSGSELPDRSANGIDPSAGGGGSVDGLREEKDASYDPVSKPQGTPPIQIVEA